MKKVIGIGVLLQTPAQTLLFQERDDSAPLHPGRITAFGGGIEGSESALQCAQREILEELNLNIAIEQLDTIELFESHNEPGSFIQIFLLKEVDMQKLKLQEGKRIVELSKIDALGNPNVTDFTKEILRSM